jgi:phosphoglycolate phosphatase
MSVTTIKGILFDMDNTLLQSRIDFAAMKRDIFQVLVSRSLLTAAFSMQEHTTSTMLAEARKMGMTDDLHASCMEIAARHEVAGMEDAGLEPDVLELLPTLHHRYCLVVVTNNSRAAAVKALDLTGIVAYFDLIVGREQMTALKPSPSGFFYAKEQLPQIPADAWISIGDSWIDGRASADAGIPFISYKKSVAEMNGRGVNPVGQATQLMELLDFLN